MTKPTLSVVIPTRNRHGMLMATLKRLAAQQGVGGHFEVIVADDGSDDGSLDLLRGVVVESFDLRTLELPARGPAHARNRGVDAARAGRVLLLGDDTMPAPDTLALHVAAVDELGVQGRIDWDPKRPVSRAMSFLAPEGPQFWFRGLSDGQPVPWAQVLGSNLSAPTAWLRDEPFDERFADACMEDTELAWRWHRRGRRVVWSERAVCYHRHSYDSIEPFLDRQKLAGSWARLAIRLHPAMVGKLVIEPVLFGAVRSAAFVARRLVGRARRREELWDLQCRAAYVRGLVRPIPRTRG